MNWTYVGMALVPVAVVVAFVLWRRRAADPRVLQAAAKAQFQEDWPRLQEAFFQAASTSGKPRGLRWKGCQWNELHEWVRDKSNGQLLALVGVTISFEAIEGGDMEGVEAVGNLRNASAVFAFDGEWRTVGRAVFNLNPDEVLEHFKGSYERVDI